MTAPQPDPRPLADFVTVPAGAYVCRVAEVRPGATRAGDERWSLRLVIETGPQAGMQAAWDSLVFSTRGRMRARMVLVALGLPVVGRVAVEPSDLLARTALVEVRPAEYVSHDGTTVRRNEVPYDGWRSAEGRMLKVQCADCGCIVRMTQKWLDDVGAPQCACGGAMAEGGAP